MNRLLDSLNELCGAAFASAGFDAVYGKVNVSSRPDLCEFQCNGAMACAKAAHRKPIEIAEAVAAVLRENEALSKAEACMPGFINMDVNGAWLSARLADMEADARLGLAAVEKPETIIVDYGGANVAKPLHVGHLRSAVIGEAIKRMGRAIGHKMIGDVHLGDWGLQMGLIIEELKDRQQTDFTLSDLEEIYPAASAKSKAQGPDGKPTAAAAAFKQRALHATSLLQSGDPACLAVWKRIMELSIEDLRKNYDRLNVSFELWKGESDVQKYIPDMIADLEKRGIAHESQGALVVDIGEPEDTKELPPCIIRKSDGASLYATTDLATLVERELLYHPDAYIYIADQRQSLHYTSFFRVARKAGIVRPEEKLTFLGFGTMNGKDGKPFKTRAGGVMRLAILIHDINEKVFEKIRSSRSAEEISDEEARSIASLVGLAALKYGDLSNQASKDYIFDLDRFTSFEGNTGPYILYTIVRITSILNRQAEAAGAGAASSSEAKVAGEAAAARNAATFRKTESGNAEAVSEAATQAADKPAALAPDAFLLSEEAAPSGKALAILLARYNEVVLQAWNELAPHKLCQYIYEVSNAFNTFYHDVRILTEENAAKQESYLALLTLTRRVLLTCIEMLGFDAPQRM